MVLFVLYIFRIPSRASEISPKVALLLAASILSAKRFPFPVFAHSLISSRICSTADYLS
jgi:hypothetical protein